MLGPFKSWRRSQDKAVTNPGYPQSTTPDGSSESSTTTSTQELDTDAPLQPSNTQDSPLKKTCQAIRKELKRYGKPGLKRDLVSWTGVMVIGTSFMMYVHCATSERETVTFLV